MAEYPSAAASLPPDASRPVVPTERVIARLRPHARSLFWPALVLIALPGATIYAVALFPELWQHVLFVVAAILLFVLLVLFPYIAWLNHRCTITTRRVIARRGFFVRERREIFHSRGYHVTLKQSWLQSALGSGDIHISSGVEKSLVLRDVPGAAEVLETLHELIERNQIVLTSHAGSPGTATAAF
ncbi:PH domain-containing protein [Mycetocola miduiensis]|uniref:PH domain-containing protein n=1 Tax=Mycetocola miduiensis TaxID=995034 RepID=A0A1I5E053_9MICO|nr:PH domain-containing protein [Mycetocola miduiensis]SFO04501.1 PH domain-containing protein [Mycetocola miduiensis]